MFVSPETSWEINHLQSCRLYVLDIVSMSFVCWFYSNKLFKTLNALFENLQLLPLIVLTQRLFARPLTCLRNVNWTAMHLVFGLKWANEGTI